MSAPVERSLDLTLDGPDESAQNKKQAICHLMPCSIEHKQVDIKAREYFWPTVRELKKGGDDEQGRGTKHDKSISESDNSKNPVLLASFRGRPLQGRRLQVPAGFLGHVVDKPQAGSGLASASKQQRMKKHFREFTYWNWDELPNENDTVVKAMNWIHIAKAIHDPID